MRDFFLKPLQGVASGLAFMLGAHALVIFLIRPISNWINNLQPSNLKALGIDGIIIWIIFLILSEIWEKVQPILNKYVGQYVKLAFFYVGKGFHSFYHIFGITPGKKGIYPGQIVIFPVIFGICFFSTFLDYLAIQANLDVSINMFSDRIVEDMEEVVSVQSMIGWIAQDQVSVSNFWQYWFYSLRASFLGYRFEGWMQWLVAFPINVAASIIFLILGIDHATHGLSGFKLKWKDNELDYDLPSGVAEPKPARPFGFFVSGIIAVFLLIGQFALSALPVNRIRQMIVTSTSTRTSTPTRPSQPPLTPQQTVAKYYELATSNREAALELMSERWKKAEKENWEEGLKFWNTLEQVKVYNTEILEQSSNTVVVKAWLQYYIKYKDYTPCETLIFKLVLDTNQNKWVLSSARDVVQKPYCDR